MSIDPREFRQALGCFATGITVVTTASREAGHELTFLWADEDDWPRGLYEKLGWDVVGRRWRLRRVVR